MRAYNESQKVALANMERETVAKLRADKAALDLRVAHLSAALHALTDAVAKDGHARLNYWAEMNAAWAALKEHG